MIKNDEVRVMKKRKLSSTIVIVLAMCLIFTGCSEDNKDTATPEQVATEQTEITSETVETQVQTEPTVETEKSTEKPTEKTESNKEKTESDKSTQSDNDTTTTNTTTNNKTNNTSSSTTTKKSSLNTNNSTSNNTSNNSTNTNNKPSSKPVTVTDDTKVTHAQFNTAENMQRMVNYIISHKQSKGMTYDSTLNINNSGWLFAYQGCLNTTANRSYNEQLSRTVNGLDEDIDSILALDGFATSYSQMSFNCYAEKQADGEYNIYFCYG